MCAEREHLDGEISTGFADSVVVLEAASPTGDGERPANEVSEPRIVRSAMWSEDWE